ncbi:DNA polymerase III subunit epsilon [Bermanella marisrubri]|uniref:DNA polymerase III subunit epsilon n=1 Tax=Bermanella marisrubri TaxID=207949 RepID=Q1MXK5_9GAMM|nr:DNA polymerase III subunit epsilon [Bermanella marisrubri]EAT10708.1 DNA polymerase III, epsilon subunit [Oceanobacter sp. RED65] [Bermanella marisrubri]QIZ84237.1 DNA polymerase III subunit epsilon [Bermanella marisrubri]
MRQVVLDTETTGIGDGHRIIEIGCVELVGRKLTGRHYHQYINPQREVDPEAMEVHGITDEFLADKPVFAQVANEFLDFINGAELVIHNAPFDVGFMDMEFAKLSNFPKTAEVCGVLDTLTLARKMYPGQRNSLDALCRRLGIDNSHRELHGALLDSEILADVYLLMTGGQTALSLASEDASTEGSHELSVKVLVDQSQVANLPSWGVTDDEARQHQEYLELLATKAEKVNWSAHTES